MMDPTPALTAHPNLNTGNVIVDTFLGQARESIRLDSGEREWAEIEQKFSAWWTTHQSWNYGDDDKSESREYRVALKVLRENLHTAFELKTGCLTFPLGLLMKYTGIATLHRKFVEIMAQREQRREVVEESLLHSDDPEENEEQEEIPTIKPDSGDNDYDTDPDRVSEPVDSKESPLS